MKKIMIIGQPRCKPIYDEYTNKFLCWRLSYHTSENSVEVRFFKNTLFSRAYKKMCRFQTRFLRQQNENTK